MVIFSPHFIKSFNKLSKKIQEKVLEKLELFDEDEFNEIFKNHKLHGEYDGYRSINITGDLRIIYEKINDETFRLYTIGTHSQLY